MNIDDCISHRAHRVHREKILFVVKEKEYLTAENAKSAEKRFYYSKKQALSARGVECTEVRSQKSEVRGQEKVTAETAEHGAPCKWGVVHWKNFV